MIGLHLLLLAAVLAAAGPRMLARAEWVYRAPRLGIAAWYALLGAVVSGVAAGIVALVAPWQPATAPVCLAWRWCVLAARGEYGPLGRLTALVVALAGAVLAARLAVTAIRLVRAALTRRRTHLELLTLTGRPCAELGAVVVDHPRPAAYVVAGRSRRIVVTTGALAVLTADELAAVLAHERAHAAGRHDLLLDCVRLLRQAFPRRTLFTTASAQLRRLVELRADEIATTRHPRISLARALVAIADAADVAPGEAMVVPAAAVAATGGDALERLQRLLTPPVPLGRARGTALAAGLFMLAAAPAALLAAAQVFPVLGMCPTLPG